MAQVDKKPFTEDSKACIFYPSRYRTGVDHTEWNRAYVLGIIRQLGIRQDLVTEAATDAVMSIVTQVVRDVLSSAVHLVAQTRRRRLEPRDVENAVDLNGFMFSFTSSRAASNTQFKLANILNKSLYPSNKFMVDLRAIMNVTPRRLPFKRRIRKHWLVIDGEQPRVPENPVITPTKSNSAPHISGAFQSTSSDSLMEEGNRAARIGNKLDHTICRPLTTHSLSLDQQVFFRKCVETVIGSDTEKRREILHLLASDPGLQSLVPRFAVLIFEGVRCNIVEQNLPVLQNILRLLKTLVDNVQVNLDKCLHDIIPALCSCVVCRELCSNPEDKRHFRLRQFAAMILAMICKRTHVADVRARITTLLCRIFTDSRANLASIYGALCALGELGSETVAAVVVPRLDLLKNRISSLKEEDSVSNSGDDVRVLRLIEKMLVRFVKHRKMPGLCDLNDFEKVFPGFGDAVYRKLKASEKHRGHADESTPQRAASESGKSAASKRCPRLPQLPMRAPGIIRPTHASVVKLRMFKNRQLASGGLLRHPAGQSVTLKPSQPVQDGGQKFSQQGTQPTQKAMTESVRGPAAQVSPQLPPVLVEPAFPRRPPTSLMGKAVTVEPAFPRRPNQR